MSDVKVSNEDLTVLLQAEPKAKGKRLSKRASSSSSSGSDRAPLSPRSIERITLGRENSREKAKKKAKKAKKAAAKKASAEVVDTAVSEVIEAPEPLPVVVQEIVHLLKTEESSPSSAEQTEVLTAALEQPVEDKDKEEAAPDSPSTASPSSNPKTATSVFHRLFAACGGLIFRVLLAFQTQWARVEAFFSRRGAPATQETPVPTTTSSNTMENAEVVPPIKTLEVDITTTLAGAPQEPIAA